MRRHLQLAACSLLLACDELNRDTPRAQWKALGQGAIAPVRWSTAPYTDSGSQGNWCKKGSLLMVSMHVTYEPYMHGALCFFCF